MVASFLVNDGGRKPMRSERMLPHIYAHEGRGYGRTIRPQHFSLLSLALPGMIRLWISARVLILWPCPSVTVGLGWPEWPRPGKSLTRLRPHLP